MSGGPSSEEPSVGHGSHSSHGGDDSREPEPPAGQRKPRQPSRLRSVALWALSFAACYGLALLVLTDYLVVLAIPGLIGCMALAAFGVLWLLYEPLGGDIPYATDGSDRLGVVRHHRAVLLRRYALLLGVIAALVAAVFGTQSDYAVICAPVAVISFFLATGYCGEQIRSVVHAARVLKVYEFTFRTPVEKLNLRAAGKRSLRLGGGESGDSGEGADGDGRSPKLAAHQPVGKLWPENIEDGVWFAGDEIFGGVVMVPGSGELMRVQPLQWDELAGERNRAGADRLAKAERAGLTRRTL